MFRKYQVMMSTNIKDNLKATHNLVSPPPMFVSLLWKASKHNRLKIKMCCNNGFYLLFMKFHETWIISSTK